MSQRETWINKVERITKILNSGELDLISKVIREFEDKKLDTGLTFGERKLLDNAYQSALRVGGEVTHDKTNLVHFNTRGAMSVPSTALVTHLDNLILAFGEESVKAVIEKHLNMKRKSIRNKAA